jgi:photosystem II stability/assembly factor-like uncharacterized protein
MSKNLGDGVSSVNDGLGYNFDRVVFQDGKPILDSELNLAQELQGILSQKSTTHLPSGWLSYRACHTSSDLSNAFYTQNPEGSKPEVALINGWPIYVTNTNTDKTHVNKIDLSQNELRSGSRVDGVFLEAWRSLISPGESDSINKPDSITKVSDINDIYMFNEDLGWAVGQTGIILHTSDGGINWNSQEIPVNINFNSVKFKSREIGYVVGDGGTILKTVNGGSTWNIVFNNVSSNLNSIYIVDSNRVCVVGDSGTVLLSIDGNTFSPVDSTGGVVDNLNCVYFYDAFIGWSVGDNGSFIKTTDGGLSWIKREVLDSDTSLAVTENINSVAFYNANDGLLVGDNGIIYKSVDGGNFWTNISGRVFDGVSYKTVEDLHPNDTNKLNRVIIKKEFPIEFSISVYSNSRSFFRNFRYQISPVTYPNSLVLEYSGVADGKDYKDILSLNSYADADELKTAINNITSPYRSEDSALNYDERQKARVFQATIGYVPVSRPTDLRPSSGNFTSTSTASLSFSIEDKAWIVGTNGIILKSDNSGSKWEVLTSQYGFDFNSGYFVDNNLGWLAATEGTIIKYAPADIVNEFEAQSTDLLLSSTGRIFPEGNIESESREYLVDNLINPQVGVETTKRVQIQYRIRVVDGVDPFNYPDAGLGSAYVFGLGPNVGGIDAGNFVFENMGKENGDYGLWRSRCRNTVDGYSWAIPMFFVTKRNSSPFNLESNINGSTYVSSGAIRPDLQTYEEIRSSDVVDIRRKININSYTHLLEKDFDNLLSNSLYTNITNRSERGDQYGTSVLAVDTYTGATEIGNLLNGRVTSEAAIVESTKDIPADPTPTRDELTFGPIEKAIFHNDPAFYRAVSIKIASGVETIIEDINGSFEGLGTNKVTFSLDTNYVPTGGTEDVVYRLVATYIDYSKIGLGRVPKIPLGVSYSPGNISDTLFYRGINKNVVSEKIEELEERVSGYRDYTIINSAIDINNSDEQFVYEEAGVLNEADTDFIRSARKFREQQFKGSLVEYHYFTRVSTATRVLRVPKNINDYSVYAVKGIRNINGSEYRVSTNFATFETIRDTEENYDSSLNTDNLIIYLDEAYTIPSNSVIEVILEVVTFDSSVNKLTEFGVSVSNKGNNIGAYRTGYVSNYNVTSKGISGFYKCIMYPIPEIQNIGINTSINTITIDLTNPSAGADDLIDGLVLGVSSFPTKEKSNQMYMWYKADTGMGYYSAVPVSSAVNLGTSTVTLNIDSRVNLSRGKGYVPILVKQYSLPSLVSSSTANVMYKYVPYQTVGGLPDSLTLEIVKNSDFVYISNLGTGSSSTIVPEPYENPIEHISVNSNSFVNDNVFSNVDDINLANFTIDAGFIKLPAMVANCYSSDVTFSKPNNVGDALGRTFYTESSVRFIYESDTLSLSTPRKVFVPLLGRVRSDILKPFQRGELVLIVMSKMYKARPENRTGYYVDNNEEYKTGYFEEADTAICLYRLTNKPIVRI